MCETLVWSLRLLYSLVPSIPDDLAKPSPLRVAMAEKKTVTEEQQLQPAYLPANMARMVAAQGHYPIQYPPFFHPQFGFFNPYAMNTNCANVEAPDFGTMGMGALATGRSATGGYDGGPERSYKQHGHEADIYDSPDFPISPSYLAFRPHPGLVTGYNGSPSKVNVAPSMNAAWVQRPHAQWDDIVPNGNLDYGGNVMPSFHTSSFNTSSPRHRSQGNRDDNKDL